MFSRVFFLSEQLHPQQHDDEKKVWKLNFFLSLKVEPTLSLLSHPTPLPPSSHPLGSSSISNIGHFPDLRKLKMFLKNGKKMKNLYPRSKLKPTDFCALPIVDTCIEKHNSHQCCSNSHVRFASQVMLVWVT